MNEPTLRIWLFSPDQLIINVGGEFSKSFQRQFGDCLRSYPFQAFILYSEESITFTSGHQAFIRHVLAAHLGVDVGPEIGPTL